MQQYVKSFYIFNSVDTIDVEPIIIFNDHNTVIAELKIVINKTEIISVIDVVRYNQDEKIISIRAYKG